MKTKKPITVLTVISGAATAVICAVMNFMIIPQIEGDSGMRCFDMSFGYSYEYATEFIAAITQTAKDIYTGIQLPLDFVYPVMYCTFFSLLIYLLRNGKSKLILIPVLLAAADYAENISVMLMLKSEALSRTLVTFASCFTSVKTVLMYACFILTAALVVRKIIDLRKKKT